MSERNGILGRINMTWKALTALAVVLVVGVGIGASIVQWVDANQASVETVQGLDTSVGSLEGGQATNRTSIDGLLVSLDRLQTSVDTTRTMVNRLYCDRWPDDCTPQPSRGAGP